MFVTVCTGSCPTTSAGNEHYVKMTTFPFRCIQVKSIGNAQHGIQTHRLLIVGHALWEIFFAMITYLFGINDVYHRTSNGRRTLVGNKIVAHSDVVGASPVGVASNASSFSTEHLASMVWAKKTAREERNM